MKTFLRCPLMLVVATLGAIVLAIYHSDKETTEEFPDPQLSDYPSLQNFDKKVTKNAPAHNGVLDDSVGRIRIGTFELARMNAVFASFANSTAEKRRNCGYYDNPIPNSTPIRRYYNGDPFAYISEYGYHLTRSYATNASYGDDYSRWRAYGACGYPAFRDHLLIANNNRTLFSIQRGEPNPEVLNYIWPYWDWFRYAEWWHNTY